MSWIKLKSTLIKPDLFYYYFFYVKKLLEEWARCYFTILGFFFFFYSFLLFSNGRCDWMFPNNSKRIEKKQKRKRNLQAVSQKRRTVGVKKGIKSKRPQAFANLRTEISACKTVTIMSTETCQFLLFSLSFLSLCSFIHGTSIKVSFFFQDFRLFFSVILTQIQYNPVYRAPRHSNDRAKHSFCWYWGVGRSVLAPKRGFSEAQRIYLGRFPPSAISFDGA